MRGAVTDARRREEELARRLRRDETEAEALLWRRIRDRALLGRKFRRQHPSGPYVVDFACIEARLVVELDGGQHDRAADETSVRTAFLETPRLSRAALLEQ